MLSRMFPIVAAVALVTAAADPAHAFVLVTPAEASLPAGDDMMPITRGITRGPTITEVTPASDSQKIQSPAKLTITFEAHNGATIDPANVKVIYVKKSDVDLTARLKPYITPTGINADNAEMPPGTHVLRLDVIDSMGRKNSKMLQIIVVKN